MDWAALTEAGLYDPAAPGAAERRELLEFLVEQGCTLDEMVAAEARGRLFGLAGDRIVRPGRDELTLREAAERAGADVGLVQRLWQAYGLPIVDADTKVASADDVASLSAFLVVASLLGEDAALGLARVAGASVARFAEAISAALRGSVPDLTTENATEARTARAFAAVATLAPAAGRSLDVLLRHHLEAVRRHFELSGSYDVAHEHQVRLAVGFADLSGFTALSGTATAAELSRLLARFEETASGTVREHGGRVVKFIGDAVMWVAPVPGEGVAAARALVDRLAAGGTAARAAVAYGVLLAQDGDYFGPAVNLAARLVDAAAPGQVVVSEPLRERLGGAFATEPLPPRTLRGIADPVTAHVVR
ncbi:MAG TPA: adenylate cyclase regulatory domain-containing protein [Mycobacteriales bacterium]|nr:adenylate cyclase regulatory domain-containing protein [Mycobacteriales bacterium]